MQNLKLLLCGFGQIGRMLFRTAARRPDLEVVAVLDSNPELIGADAGIAAGGSAAGIPVAGRLGDLGVRPDAAVVTTVSDCAAAAGLIEELARAGIPVATTCEELAFPRPLHAEVADRLDAAARAGGVAVLGTGINPGFLMDYLVAALSGLTGEVRHVHVQRFQNAAPRRPAFQKKIGAGQTLAEFERNKAAGQLRHVGLPESVYFVAAALGWKLDRVTESIEPVVAEEALQLPGAIPVAAGEARGVRQSGRGFIGEREVIHLEFLAAIGEPESFDRIHLEGTPELDSTIRGGVNGDQGTCAITLNAVRAVAGCGRTGLLTMLDLLPVTGRGW